MFADAVIEGGGVKGIGLVGAIYEAEKRGYEWIRLAGASAGSIIAALLAAGYSAEELKKEIMNLDYSQFNKKEGIVRIPVLGSVLNLWINNGIYSGNYIEQWTREKLLAKGVTKFQDLEKMLYIIASDITNGEMLVLPDDIKRFGISPGSLDVAKAVRMSCSIPYYFKPVKIIRKDGWKNTSNFIIDGGVLSNFPVWIFDRERNPKWPTFGFRLTSEKTGQPHKISNPVSMGFAIISTMLEAHDEKHIEEKNYVRTILVPTMGVKTTDFNISKIKSEELFISGVKAGEKFFKQWDFAKYAIKYRSTSKIV
ncbi:MAG: patatin-like phospholipase family protein [Vulcanibacillus sp.]